MQSLSLLLVLMRAVAVWVGDLVWKGALGMSEHRDVVPAVVQFRAPGMSKNAFVLGEGL